MLAENTLYWASDAVAALLWDFEFFTLHLSSSNANTVFSI